MYKQGTVILIPFPFSDRSEEKVRPAVIVSKGLTSSEVVVVFITSKKKSDGVHAVNISPSEQNGLKAPSTVVCSKLATVHKQIVLGELGLLSEKDLKTILKEVKTVLGL
jgi:mRNA interferase MazF